ARSSAGFASDRMTTFGLQRHRPARDFESDRETVGCEFRQRRRSARRGDRGHREQRDKREQHTPEHGSHTKTTFLVVSFRTRTPSPNRNETPIPVSLHSAPTREETTIPSERTP